MILSFPINNLSLAFCGINIAQEFFKENKEVKIFPVGNADLQNFDKLSAEFKAWLKNGVEAGPVSYSRNEPELSIWHAHSGSEKSIGVKSLFTFYELDSPTKTEVNILNNQEIVFVSNPYTREVFQKAGVKSKVVYAPLGFDSTHFSQKPRNKFLEKRTVWGIFGKAEKRKSTLRTVRLWLARFGNNPNHILHLSIYNPFWNPEQNQAFLNECFQGKSYYNVNALPYTNTLSEYNSALNSVDIVLDMSVGEGWSLPSFSAVAMGKHALVCNCAGVAAWADKDNAILVNPSGMEPAIDGVFFHGKGSFNVGNWFKWDDVDFNNGLDIVLERSLRSRINEEGLKLQEKFTFKKTYEIIKDELLLD